MEEIIINKVAQSSIETIDLEKFYPDGESKVFDLKDFLFLQLILKEKDYREQLKNLDWSVYQDKNICITCSVDAIIPLWAYMLATTYLEPIAKEIFVGTEQNMLDMLFLKNLWKINVKEYFGKRVVIKGCGEKEIPAAAYAEITKILRPVAKSIMFGEPCSTVPVYKQEKSKAK